MSREYGLFGDEGLVEGDFWSPEEARKALEERYEADDELTVEEICPDHRCFPRNGCEECEADDEMDAILNQAIEDEEDEDDDE